MPFSNPLTDAWANNRTTYGIWCTLPGSIQAEIISRQGPDYVCIDYQHGLIDHSDAISMFQAIENGGSVGIARVGWNEPARIMQILDAGAQGVVIPMVNNAQEAAQAVAAFRYPPVGSRSFGPVRSRDVLGTSSLEGLATPACIVMIETAEGIQNAAEIAATPGVDCVYIGPSDLSISLGLPYNQDPPSKLYLDTVADIVRVCRDSGVAVGMQRPNGASARQYAEQGFDMVTVASDGPLFAATIRDHLAQARGNPDESSGDVKSTY